MFNKNKDQEIFFDNKTRRWVENIIEIKQGAWWHIRTKDGTEYIINPDKINFIRINNTKK
jgi:beta-lactamase class D